ncbi:regucalcin-like [Glandiceps talaboti]
MSVSVILKKAGILTEGPHWDEKTQTLLFVNIYNPSSVNQWNSVTQSYKELIVPDVAYIGTAVPRQQGGYVVASDRKFCTLDFDSGEMTTLVEVDEDRPKSRFNDGKCDAAGRFWAGTMGEEKVPTKVDPQKGRMYSLNKDHNVVRHFDKIGISNGLGWSLDNKIMYYIDTPTKRVDAFDFDLEKGELSNRRTVFNIPEGNGFPDGMTVDADGKLWVAMYLGGRLLRIDPVTSTLMQTLEMPVSCPTSCCFGGANYDELYITSASQYYTEEQLAKEPLAGSVFKVTGLGVKGLPPNTFSG